MIDIELKTSNRTTAIGVYDPFTAMIAVHSGAEALWLSSYSYCASQGIKDIGLLPFVAEDNLITRIRHVVNKPIIVDIDNGFGSVAHAEEIVFRLQNLGASGICIEDKKSPKLSSLYTAEQSLLSVEEMTDIVSGIKRKSPDMKLIARLEGLNYGEDIGLLHDKIKFSYEAGADCVIVHNVQNDVSALKHIVTENENIPMGIIPTKYMDKLPEVGHFPQIVLVIYANQILRACYDAVSNATQSLLHSPEEIDGKVASISLINKLFYHV